MPSAEFVAPALPAFEPHPLLRGGHAQMLAGYFSSKGRGEPAAPTHQVRLDDGDEVVLHENCPVHWRAGAPAALLVHGLAGCHQSPYMSRVARKLCARGVRAFRMDLRSCGAGLALARRPYHSGRSEDCLAALWHVDRLCGGGPLAVVGFSLGGNIVLKMLGEDSAALPPGLRGAVAVCPPVDLLSCVEALRASVNRFYDRYFARLLVQHLQRWRQARPDAPPMTWERPPRGLREFDDAFTAPVCGFGTALEYYRRCSSAQFVPKIDRPTLILAAADDFMVAPAPLRDLRLPDCVTLHVAPSGGHLGFIARFGTDPDRRWMDWRVVDWVLAATAIREEAGRHCRQ
jgi:hypothetical protein